MSKAHTDPTPETTHRGHAIRYGLNEDVWYCDDLNLQAEKLSTLKDKINRELRRVAQDGAPVLAVRYHSVTPGTEALVTRVYWARENRFDRETNRYKWISVLKCDVCISHPDKRRVHHKRDLSEFAPSTSQTVAAIAEWERLSAEANAARKKADDFLASIPAVSLEDIGLPIENDGEQLRQAEDSPLSNYGSSREWLPGSR